MKLALVLFLFAQEGWTDLPAGDEKVRVYRDAHGIPHIHAKTVRGAFWGEGYSEAQDRFQQMEKLRRVARGEAAEIFGSAMLQSDIDVRRNGYTEAERKAMVGELEARTREILRAYSDGVNAHLRETKSSARPWTPTDCLALGIMMARKFGEAGRVELQIRQVYGLLVKQHGEKKAQDILYSLLPDADPSAPTTLHDHDRTGRSGSEGGRLRPGRPMEDFEAFARRLEEARRGREALGVPSYFGSNAWVVAPQKSATGRAMLYGAPMMGFRTPSICNEIRLVADGLDVAGMSFPGVPGVMIGWNRHVAWTTTSGGADLVDVFTLELNERGQYRYRGAWRDFERIEEEIAVRGERPRKVAILRSVHGPVLGEPDRKNRRAHTLRYSFWKKEGRTIEGVFAYNFARSVAEFQAAMPKIVTSHNFFAADREGNIGFWFCGLHPVRRKGHDPRFPQPGDGSMDWEGILPFEKWPQAINPSHHFFANWNNKPSRAWNPSPYGKIFWGKKIIEDLEAKEKLTFEEFQAIARRTAYHDYIADYFLPYLLRAAEGMEGPEVVRAIELLRKWDRMKRPGDPCPEIVERWVFAMARKVFGKDLPVLLLAGRRIFRYVVSPLLYVLEGEKAPVRMRCDFTHGRDLKKLGQEALRDALRPGLGWKEPRVDFGPGVGRVPSAKGRGTFQMTVEMGPEGPTRVETLAAPGQSEDPKSPHYRDQVELFRAWKYKPFEILIK